MTATEIRVADLVKATSKQYPENYAVFRVVSADAYWVENHVNSFQVKTHDFEVLDRPLPPIDEALLLGAVKTYVTARRLHLGEPDNYLVNTYGHGIAAAINYLRENDNHLKESK